MGVVGWCELDAVDEDVTVKSGDGSVVTGTFEHVSNNVIDLYTAASAAPIGVTTNHPFWSEDRHDFVPAGELAEGERVLLYSGETKSVVQKLPRPGPQRVYNLEVYSEHVYLVSKDGVLVHNEYAESDVCENLPKFLYHYTNQKGYDGIITSGTIRPSTAELNTHYGVGQYFSDIKPGMKTPTQLGKAFKHVPNKYLYTHVVQIRVPVEWKGKLRMPTREGNNIYLLPNETALDIRKLLIKDEYTGKVEDIINFINSTKR